MIAHRTKIVATIGPASSSPGIIEQMVDRGMNVARLNFSHGSYQDHAQTIELLRLVSTKLAMPITILQDLQGPKIIDVYHRLNLIWGVRPIHLEHEGATFEELVITAEKYLLDKNLVEQNDKILIMGGIPTQTPQGTNFLKIHTVGKGLDR